MHDLALIALAKATWQTIYMVFISGAVSLFFGLLIGVLLFITSEKKSLINKTLNKSAALIVDATRSLPFIILLISIIPLTQLIVGTTIGTNAAIVPLTLAAIPFFARVCEAAFSEVPKGLLETAQALGANTRQQVTKFLIPESLPALIKGGTLTIIGLIGYSAMAGTVGGGGLGELAINYGYERFNVAVMLETALILIIIVQLIQSLGDYYARNRHVKGLAVASVLFAILCFITQLWPNASNIQHTLKVGVVGGLDAKIIETAKAIALKRYHLQIDIVPFNDYIQPNTALNNGSIDANIFQHIPYLKAQIKAKDYKLSAITKTFVYPFGFYSKTIQNVSELQKGAMIAIPNDPSNEGRALLLLAKHHLITLHPGSGLFPTPKDIIANPKDLRFIELNVAQIPRALNNIALGGVTNNYSKPAGLEPSKAVLLEGADSPYANVLVVRTKEKNNPVFKQFMAVIQSHEFVQATMKAYPNGAAIAAFNRGSYS